MIKASGPGFPILRAGPKMFRSWEENESSQIRTTMEKKKPMHTDETESRRRSHLQNCFFPSSRLLGEMCCHGDGKRADRGGV